MANRRVLIDTNVVVRFLVRDHEEHYLESVEIFRSIEAGRVEAMLMDFIMAEIVYVLNRVYKIEKREIASALKRLLFYKSLYTDNKLITFEALDIYGSRNIDFADALLCSKQNLEGFEIVSFDKDIGRCAE